MDERIALTWNLDEQRANGKWINLDPVERSFGPFYTMQ